MGDERFEQKWVDRVKEFVSVAVHSILYARELYPAFIFQQRKYLGITVWQSRHPEVNDYIAKVLSNAHRLMECNLVDRFVVSCENAVQQPIDHVTIKCVRDFEAPIDAYSSGDAYRQQIGMLEEEFRSIVLRLGMLDQQLTKPPEDATWKLMVITKSPHGGKDIDLMQTTLTNGQWFVDNNQLSEQLSASMRTQRKQPKLVPLKSFRGGSLNMSVYAHVFTVSTASASFSSSTGASSAAAEEEDAAHSHSHDSQLSDSH